MTGDLFGVLRVPAIEPVTDGAIWLRAFADDEVAVMMQTIYQLIAQAPLRQMQTPGGHTMSVAMSNCGELGWVTDRRGYRYQREDPLTQQPWPPMPEAFSVLAMRAAQAAGFAGFVPDACLINRYAPGARMTLHQDKNERDMGQPIVSVSLGLPAIFLFGGAERAHKPLRMRLESGDVVVWGGPARLLFHGVDTLAQGMHDVTGGYRYNLTFRKAG